MANSIFVDNENIPPVIHHDNDHDDDCDND